MSLTLISTPEKTVNGLLSNANAGRSQLPYEFFEDDLVGKPGYKVNIQIWDSLNTTQLINLTFRFATETDGRLFIDVGQILTNLQEFGLLPSLEYVLRYQPGWEGSGEAWESTGKIQSLYAKKQIGLPGGSNLWEHLLIPEPHPPGTAKLLTKFEEPFVWRGWGRSLGALHDTNLTARTGEAIIKYFKNRADINKVLGGTIEASQNEAAGPSRIVGVTVPGSDDYYTVIRVLENAAIIFLGETIYYKNLDECPRPVMIEWRSSLGAPEQHLFSINQEVNLQASPGLAYAQTHSQDQELIIGDKTRIFSEGTQAMILVSEGLTNNQIKALAEIKTSPQVYVYLAKDGSSKVRVICRDGLATPYDTKGTRQEFRLVIEFPDSYDFFEAKQY